MNKTVSLPSATKLRRLCFYRRLSVHRGVCLSAWWDTHTPQEQTPPGVNIPPRSRHPKSRHPSGADTPLRTDTQPQSRPPMSRHPPKQTPPKRRPLLWTVRILLKCILVTSRNEVVAKVMFLQVSVILSTGGVSGEPPPRPRRTPLPDQADTPPEEADTPQTKENPPRPGRHTPNPLPGRGRHPPRPGRPPPGRRLQHTVNERPVRILLECILVKVCSHDVIL